MPPVEAPTVSLAEEIGQMLMVGFRGLAVDANHPIVSDIRDRHLGSVVLFDRDLPSGQPVRNIQSPGQVRELVASLQAAAQAPLLVAIDQEGGLVSRLTEERGFPSTVSHQYLGELNDPAETHRQAGIIGETLAGLGINLNLAPVVDLCANPDNPVIARFERCFSADAQVVAAQAEAYVRAHHERGVLCTLKHFPGHGSSSQDSHLGLVDVTDTWTRTELEPYARLIEAGLVDAVMTAHIYNTHLDPDYPATLSPATITGLLRGELGYDGVVISDDMQMGAIAQHYGLEVAVHQAIVAGVDILAFANNTTYYDEQIATRAVTIISELVAQGAISKGRIDESYRRIMRLKQRLQA